MSILIGALSAANYDDRRKTCTDTWMAVAGSLGMDAVFLIGDAARTAPQRDRRRLFLPVPDDYPSLPQKTRAFCRWALDRPGWQYLFKCDDDTAVAATRLAAYATDGRDYIGAEWRRGVDYGSGGAGYLLSRQAATIVAERLTGPVGAEDAMVGAVLREAGIRLSIEPRFIPWGSMVRRPRPENDLITAHAVGRDVFEAIHQWETSL